jgi:hypothetical protein
MPLTPQRVGGQLAAAKATLYTVPASTTVVVLKIVVTNENTAARTFNLYLHDGSASRRITPVDCDLDGEHSADVVGPFTMEAGDLIEGDASVAADLDYWIALIEKTA